MKSLIAVAVAIMILCSGCFGNKITEYKDGQVVKVTESSELKDKTVLASANSVGVKGSSVADTSTGTPAPSFWLGLVNFLFLTHPSDAPAFIYYKQSSATFNAEAKDTTFIWIDKGATANLKVEPDKIISIPGVSVVSGSSHVNISASVQTDSGAAK
jgi:hypothetical protein